MSHIWTITRLTFHEAWRRWMVLIALLLGALFVLFYSIGFKLIADDINASGVPDPFATRGYNFLVLAGLYVVHFLTVMLSIFASVDAVAGEITSHTIQTIVTKPVRRWQVLLGKWLGYAAMLVVYLTLLSGALLGATYLLVRYLPPNPLQGVALLLLEALVLLSLSLLGGTRLTTLSNGVALFMLYGVTFVGTWIGQIGSVLNSEAAVRIGSLATFLLPVEILWRRAAYLLEPQTSTGLGNIATPFSAFTAPSPDVVTYAVVYAALALLLALLSFSRRDL
jgi:ABC-type transport system involved in multi-copper enzyme maturation permease subunit